MALPNAIVALLLAAEVATEVAAAEEAEEAPNANAGAAAAEETPKTGAAAIFAAAGCAPPPPNAKVAPPPPVAATGFCCFESAEVLRLAPKAIELPSAGATAAVVCFATPKANAAPLPLLLAFAGCLDAPNENTGALVVGEVADAAVWAPNAKEPVPAVDFAGDVVAAAEASGLVPPKTRPPPVAADDSAGFALPPKLNNAPLLLGVDVDADDSAAAGFEVPKLNEAPPLAVGTVAAVAGGLLPPKVSPVPPLLSAEFVADLPPKDKAAVENVDLVPNANPSGFLAGGAESALAVVDVLGDVAGLLPKENVVPPLDG